MGIEVLKNAMDEILNTPFYTLEDIEKNEKIKNLIENRIKQFTQGVDYDN